MNAGKFSGSICCKEDELCAKERCPGCGAISGCFLLQVSHQARYYNLIVCQNFPKYICLVFDY